MKKVVLVLAILFSVSAFTVSCKEKKETPAEQVKEAADEAGDKIEQGVEEVEDEIDDMTDEN
jgi:ABC-type transporter MlaC component